MPDLATYEDVEKVVRTQYDLLLASPQTAPHLRTSTSRTTFRGCVRFGHFRWDWGTPATGGRFLNRTKS